MKGNQNLPLPLEGDRGTNLEKMAGMQADRQISGDLKISGSGFVRMGSFPYFCARF